MNKQEVIKLVEHTWVKGFRLDAEDSDRLRRHLPEVKHRDTFLDRCLSFLGVLDLYQEAGRPAWGAFCEWWHTIAKPVLDGRAEK